MAAESESSPDRKVVVKTTLPKLPLPPSTERQPFRTDRLLMRPLTLEDVPVLHKLRTTPEVMKWTSRGRVDDDVEFTRQNTASLLPPNDSRNYAWAICLAETGELVGTGATYAFQGETGWPEVGYMFSPEHWGKGYASEFVQGYVEHWWKLPREEVELEVDECTLPGGVGDGGEERTTEMIAAVTATVNGPSQKVLTKAGFVKVKTFLDEEYGKEQKKGEERLVIEGDDGMLVAYAIKRPSATSS